MDAEDKRRAELLAAVKKAVAEAPAAKLRKPMPKQSARSARVEQAKEAHANVRMDGPEWEEGGRELYRRDNDAMAARNRVRGGDRFFDWDPFSNSFVDMLRVTDPRNAYPAKTDFPERNR